MAIFHDRGLPTQLLELSFVERFLDVRKERSLFPAYVALQVFPERDHRFGGRSPTAQSNGRLPNSTVILHQARAPFFLDQRPEETLLLGEMIVELDPPRMEEFCRDLRAGTGLETSGEDQARVVVPGEWLQTRVTFHWGITRPSPGKFARPDSKKPASGASAREIRTTAFLNSGILLTGS